jgi:hypothetical protein
MGEAAEASSCEGNHTHSCCHTEKASSLETTCCHAKQEVKRADSSSEVRLVLAIEAARCSGVDLSWICAKIGITPPSPIVMAAQTTGLVTWFTLLDQKADSLPPEPVIPPPRILISPV